MRFFEEQAQDNANRVSVRNKCAALHSRLSEPLFQLYLFFLVPQLDMLAKLNKWLQQCELSLHVVYSKIRALVMEPISGQEVTAHQELSTLEVSIQKIPGCDFQKHYHDCIEHSLITERELKEAEANMCTFITTVTRSLIERFPEMDFIIDNTSFLDPSVIKQIYQP